MSVKLDKTLNRREADGSLYAANNRQLYVLVANGPTTRTINPDDIAATETLVEGFSDADLTVSAGTGPFSSNADGQFGELYFPAANYDLYTPADSTNPITRWQPLGAGVPAEVASLSTRVDAVESSRPDEMVKSRGLNSAAIDAAITAAGVGGTIHFSRATYTLTKRHDLLSGQSVTFDAGVVFNCTAAAAGSPAAYFYATGTEGTRAALDANASAGATAVTLPAGVGAGWADGDVLVLNSAASYQTGGYLNGEMHRVISIAGDVLTLDSALEFSYLTADTAQYSKASLLDPITWGPGARFISSNPTGNPSYAIFFDKVDSPRIDVALQNMSGGVLIYDCLDPDVRARVDRLPNLGSAYGYGAVAAGYTRNARFHLTGRGTRHIFTTLGRGASQLEGCPLHISVSGIAEASTDGLAPWDTHPPGRHINFNHCIARGANDTGVPNFQIRSQDTTVNAPDSERGNRGIAVVAGAKRTKIQGGRVAYCGAEGISDAGEDTRIVGVETTENRTKGIVSTGTRPVVKGCHAHRNGRGFAVGGEGIDVNGATSPTVEDNLVPFSFAAGEYQYYGTRAPATGVVRNNTLRGYAVRTAAIVAPAGCVRDGNHTGQIFTIAAAAAIDVETEDIIKINGATIIDTINKGTAGREITLIFTTAGGASDGVGNVKLSAAFTATADDTLTLVSDGTNWFEKSRSAN